MSAYQIGEVRYQNFGPFVDATVDFAQPGLTVIDGQIAGNFGCDSNGSGKSMLFDGVAWALFGRCLRERYATDDVRRHTWNAVESRNEVPPGAWTCVTVTVHRGDDTLSIARYRKHPVYKDHVRLAVNGVDRTRGTTPETTNTIVQTLGMDFNAFCNSVAFAAREDVRSFLSEGASDTERKHVLEKILGLELYAAAQGVARKRLQAVALELTDLEATRLRAEVAIEEKRALLDSLRTPEELAALDVQIKRARLAIAQKQRARTAHQARLERWVAEQAVERQHFQKVEDQHERETLRYEELREEHVRHAQGHERQAAEHQGHRNTLQGQITRILALGGKSCPACQQTLPAGRAKQLASDLRKQVAGLDRQIAECQTAAHAARTALASLSAPPPLPRSFELESLAHEIAVQEDVLRRLAGEIRAEERVLATLQEQYAQAEGQHTQLEAAVTAAQTQLAQTTAAMQAKRQHAERLEFWVDGFGNRGLKSFLIEAEIPRINRAATRIAQRLLGAGAYIRLNATTELKTRKATKEQLSIDAVIPGCTNTYAGASRGQKKRLDLALILALRETVAARAVKGFQQLFADEVFDGLDTSGTDTVGDLLRELAMGCPVALVSHSPAIQALADRVVTVYHADGVAQLEPPTASAKPRRPIRKVRARTG